MAADTEPDAPPPDQTVYKGIGVSAGVTFGVLAQVDPGGIAISEETIDRSAREEEAARLDRAVKKSRRQILALKRIRGRLSDAAKADLADILDAHVQMLGDSRLVRGARERIARDGMNAAAAIKAECERIAVGFAGLDDPYLAARAEDVREVGRRVLRNLSAAPKSPFAALEPSSVAVADTISPADTATMDPDRIAGFAAAQGGAQGHTAILARSLGIPAVLGLDPAALHLQAGAPVILDGGEGLLIANPDPSTAARYREKLNRQQLEARRLEALIGQPAVTRDAVTVRLEANVELPREAEIASRNGADGVGLFRTEFLFMNRPTAPSEEEQYRTLAAVVDSMTGRPVTIRTMDLGGEKLSYALGDDMAASPNPALGLRAIRLSLRRPKLLETQLCAILRAGAHGPVRILLPMITTAGEVRQVRDILHRMVRRLRRRGVPFADPPPPVGVMIEIPGAALAADSLAQVSDFFAIGTNDLTQYTLAIDRSDEQVSHLYAPLHPAVLRLIDAAVQSALRARIPVSVCGEMAGDPALTALLVGMGVRDLSMAATNLLRVKQRVRQIECTAACARARMVLESHDSGRIRMLLEDLNGVR